MSPFVTVMATNAEAESDTGAYLVIILLTLGLIGLVVLGLWFGWRARRRRQVNIPAPLPVPDRLLATEPLAQAQGMYVSTVRGEDWLDRVAVHGLGIRTRAQCEVHPLGVVLLLEGSPNFVIPFRDITQISTSSGMVGKFVEKDGLITIGWNLGQIPVTTGFRTRNSADQHTLLETMHQTSQQRQPE
ncbi:hypothetical protein QDX23_03280 [Auritidibacter ignavus]|uniref:PH-like domain-containing protein n=1 Tax=Auritidibacter ignavus TaxID=678932 RepID=UPI0024497F83|nr:hypothetical protein [Auritidibacter ignavus]WGH86817.1 hypothetical protein QDX24_03150 [Auritidibacter ignavus]WGH89102.1 hypothetical protein QDX22_03145 [Auritidibacter ignavus]WGH91402.1 hypothetical protein QDX23_03280 [Auritidibacter ignavus]